MSDRNGTAGVIDSVESFTLNYISGYEWNKQVSAGTPRPEYLNWNQLPFSSVWSPIMGITVYFWVILIGERAMKYRKPYVLKLPLFLHNAFLALISVVIFVGLMRSASELYSMYGFHYIWRDYTWSLQNTELQLWCYIFYVSKYYELLDTVFLIARKKPVRLVQKWHHASVLLLFWSYNNSRMIVHYYLAVVNSFVHIFVYGFFVCATLHIRVPWKNYITALQIGQFVFALIYSSPLPFYKLLAWQPYTGDWGPFLLGQFIGITFVLLFGQVYLHNTRISRSSLQHTYRISGQLNHKKTDDIDEARTESIGVDDEDDAVTTTPHLLSRLRDLPGKDSTHQARHFTASLPEGDSFSRPDGLHSRTTKQLRDQHPI